MVVRCLKKIEGCFSLTLLNGIKNIYLIITFLFVSETGICNFPTYFELNMGESMQAENYPTVKLISKRIIYYDSTLNRIGSAEVEVKINNTRYKIPVGYENEDLQIGNVRIGVELISDYEKEFKNQRIHLSKDTRLRISKANEPLMPHGSHLYPLFTPWNSGFRNQSWLSVCINIESIEGNIETKPARYHDGWDIGTWEGQLVRSVSTGVIVSPDDYPELIEKGLLYNKNNAPVGPNAFIVKSNNLPILYYYTHLSGLTRNFSVGDIIKKGEVLGYASDRGSSGGWYHLHFSIIHLEKGIHVNPFPFLNEWYTETMSHYDDFLTNFDVFSYKDGQAGKLEFEKQVIEGTISPDHTFNNSVAGIVHVREAVAICPNAGLNHVIFNQFAVLKSHFISNEKEGELWFGHTGVARLYLNGRLVYFNSDDKPYHRSIQPFQWDSKMVITEFIKGKNEIVIVVEQTNPFWSFSIRPRNRLGGKLTNH